MQIAVLGDPALKDELLSNNANAAGIVWINNINEFEKYAEADAFIDLLFENEKERVSILQQCLPKLVFVNSVIDTLPEIHPQFIRINGWNGFLKSALIEASCLDEALKRKAGQVFQQFAKQLEWLPDEPGFITPRIISMIINEAFFALEEGVSTPKEINTAMKLGTAYPYGPFEWGEKIGLQNISTLLHKLSHQQPRYTPCELLVQETDKSI